MALCLRRSPSTWPAAVGLLTLWAWSAAWAQAQPTPAFTAVGVRVESSLTGMSQTLTAWEGGDRVWLPVSAAATCLGAGLT